MIEEVEITDDMDPSELGNQELVHSEDFNAVLKQLPPEAFNELFSGKSSAFLDYTTTRCVSEKHESKKSFLVF